MSRYSYKLYQKGRQEVNLQKKYRYSEISNMTTYQLKEICCKEKLVKNRLDPLNREELLHLIMRYRGKTEASFITHYDEEGLERLNHFLKKATHLLQRDTHLTVPAKITLYKDLAVTPMDGYCIQCRGELTEGNMLLVNEKNEICTIFNLVYANKSDYYLTKSKYFPVKENVTGKYRLLYFSQSDSDFLYSLYHNETRSWPCYVKYYEAPILELKLKSVLSTPMPLVIDFGTSNTTVGIYEDGIQYVKVIKDDMTSEQLNTTVVIPSVVAIKCIIGDTPQYVFGYDAMKLAQASYLDEEMPIFYDIKRWVSDPERLEKITASDGQYTLVKRKHILKAYLEYVIDLASQQFKYNFDTIQLLSPVRQKHKFEKLFKELLAPYKVKCDLDEGMAVIFNTISDLITKEKYQQNKWYQALVIDCGGGTTDLMAAQFKIENHRVAYTIDLQSSYENGDTNFGGNNLTYRILQLLKIRIAHQLEQAANWEQDNLAEDLFELVDMQGKDAAYEALDQAYEAADLIIPTRFKNYEGQNLENYFKAKSNYYYLFEVAERIKKLFYETHCLYELKIGSHTASNPTNHVQGLTLDKWKLSYFRQGELSFLPEIKAFSLYLYEIQSLLKAEVYSLMKKFLEELYEEDRMFEFDMIKLTGQSCKMDLFKEILKEFIPGRLVGGHSNQGEQHDLKLRCLKGALQYIADVKHGYVELHQAQQVGALPYELVAYTHQNKEKILAHSLYKQEETGYISRFHEGVELKLYLNNPVGESLKVYKYAHVPQDFKLTTYEEIDHQYPERIIQDETDNIVNGETKYFVWVERAQWGFYVLPILREQDKLYQGKAVFYDFEDDTWEENFFDGLK